MFHSISYTMILRINTLADNEYYIAVTGFQDVAGNDTYYSSYTLRNHSMAYIHYT